jgi:hypothetical protein
MRYPLSVQAFVMSAVAGQDGAAERMGAGQNVSVRGRGSPVLLSGPDVVAKPPQLLHR